MKRQRSSNLSFLLVKSVDQLSYSEGFVKGVVGGVAVVAHPREPSLIEILFEVFVNGWWLIESFGSREPETLVILVHGN